MEDIRLDEDWQLTRAANGDAPVIGAEEAFLQGLRLESMTQEGDLFYDLEYGWSLLDFIQCEDDELTTISIRERIRSKMAKHPEVDVSSLRIETNFTADKQEVELSFKQKDSDNIYMMVVSLDRIRVEVVEE